MVINVKLLYIVFHDELLRYSVRVSPAMVNRIVDAAREMLNKCVSDIYIYTDHCKGSQAGR
jgi:RNA 3'-terminal phosphate cyclase-like protein